MTPLLRIFLYQRRWLLPLAAVLLALVALLVPTRAHASCGVTDTGACLDAVQYSGFYALASLAWLFVRTLLLVAYSVGVFQTWIVEGVFPSAYQVLVEILKPFVVPIALTAVVLGALSFLVLPWWGEPMRIVNLRRVFVWIIVVPLFFAQSGAWISGVEQARATTAQGIYSQVAAIVPGAIFGASAGDMRAPSALYPANPCGMSMTRAVPGVQPDDMAAALVYADAADINCPAVRGPDANLPDAFFIAKSAGGPGYGVNGGSSSGGVGDSSDVTFRQNAIDGMQQGTNRLWLALLPAGMAIVAAAVNLLFALALLVTWVGLPIALLFVFFVDFSSGFAQVVRRAIAVMVTSWSAALVQGMVFGALDASARSGNAASFTAVCVVALFLQLFLVFTAGRQLLAATSTISQVIEAGSGLSLASGAALAGSVVGAGAGLAVGAATGGAALAGGALTAASAARSALTSTQDEDGTGGNRSFALGAALGTSGPLMRVGEIATSLGALDADSDVVQGMDAGARYAHSPAYGRETMRRAARREGPDGSTLVERGSEQQLEAQAQAALHRGDNVVRDRMGEIQTQPRVDVGERPTDTQTVSSTAVHAGRLLRLGYAVQQDADAGTTTFWRAANTASDSEDAASRAGEEQDAPVTPMQTHTRQQLHNAQARVQLIKQGALTGSLRTARAAVVEHTDAVTNADRLSRGETISGDLVGQMSAMYGGPVAVRAGAAGEQLAVSPARDLPAYAQRAPAATVDQDQLVGLGYTVQPVADTPDQLAFYPTNPDQRPTTPIAQAEERADLAAAGALAEHPAEAAHGANQYRHQEVAYTDGAALVAGSSGEREVRPRVNPPARAHARPASAVNRDRLLDLGYTVQRGPEESVQFWRPDVVDASATPEQQVVRRAQEEVALLEAGAVQGDRGQAEATLFRASRTATIARQLDQGQSVWMDRQGVVQAMPRWQTPPPEVTTAVRSSVDVGQLLAAGNVVQRGTADGTVQYWPTERTIANPTPSPDLPQQRTSQEPPSAPDAPDEVTIIDMETAPVQSAPADPLVTPVARPLPPPKETP